MTAIGPDRRMVDGVVTACRQRIHFELAVPSDLAPTRLATTLAAGGRLRDESDDRWRVADPEGNEVDVVGRT